MNRVRIKICGITSADDALRAAELGVDALGFNFYKGSPRYVSQQRAAAIIERLPPFVTCVGLFVDSPHAEVQGIIDGVPLDLLQFHGAEEHTFCESFELPYIKAINVSGRPGWDSENGSFARARALLFDGFKEGVPGGTGETVDWARLRDYLEAGLEKNSGTSWNRRVVLAGGLTPDNVVEAIRIVRPFAVDVSGGVEQSKGVKDHQKIEAFIRAVGDA